jgi:hypothetical protein
MPMSLPLLSTSGPPELPGLIAASVWIRSDSNRPALSFGSPSGSVFAVMLTPDTADIDPVVNWNGAFRKFAFPSPSNPSA